MRAFTCRYGSYEMSNDPGFNRNKLSLIDRGFTYAIAHIRGGGDMGRQWYEDGKFLKKKNTFNDFIAVAEHLIAHKYTSPSNLCIEACCSLPAWLGNQSPPEIMTCLKPGRCSLC